MIESVSVRKVRLHPDNPRRGFIDAIVESLTVHGQYKPIVVNRRTSHIIAGNHTFKAVKQLGHRHINVVWVDVDDQTERRMMLADNRMADLALTNDAMVSDLLGTLPDLTGTGYSDEFIQDVVEPKADSSGEGKEPDGQDAEEEDQPRLSIGPFRADIERTQYLWWASELADLKRAEVISILRMRLEFPDVDSEQQTVPRETVSPSVSTDVGWVPITDVHPHPTNPREGDVGALMQSLTEFGQYRPIVTDTNGTILAGHHVWYAAKGLGWETIWVTSVDVSEEQALKILLVDNRTSDLGEYDSDQLAATLSSVANLTGTGYDYADVESILRGAPSTPQRPTGKASCVVGDYRWREPKAVVDDWASSRSLSDVADLLGLPRESLT